MCNVSHTSATLAFCRLVSSVVKIVHIRTSVNANRFFSFLSSFSVCGEAIVTVLARLDFLDR